MSKKTKRVPAERRTTSIRKAALREAQMACAITGKSMTDFVTAAVESAARPIVRKHVMALASPAGSVD